MSEQRIKIFKAGSVAVLGSLLILGLNAQPANGKFWQWPFESHVAGSKVVNIAPAKDISDESISGPLYKPEQQNLSGVDAVTPSGKSIYIPVLMYHHVGDLSEEQRAKDPLASDLTVSPADFESQVQYFVKQGFHSITAKQLYAALAKGEALPKKPVIFTFDDGYADVFQNAVPILIKYNYTGTFAIATELLGRPSYGTWDDVLAAHAQGMEIISHTENHLDLTSPKYSEEDLRREIFDSKKILEAKLGEPVDFFVYPYGKYNDRVEQLAGEAGYKMAYTTLYGVWISENKLLAEPRVRVHGKDGLEKLKLILEPKPHTDTAQINP